VDLLKDPQFIASTLAIKRQALQAGVSQAQMLLTRFPSNDAKVKAAAAAFSSAQDTFVKAQNNLLNTYTANTVTAINIYLSKMSALPPEATAALDAVTEMKDAVSKVSQANGDSDNVPAKKDGTSPLTKADIDALAAGQTTLIAAQSGLITSSQKLADAGMTLASEQAASFGDLPLILSRLQAQLAEVTDLQTQLTTSILTAGNRTPTTLNKAYPETYKTAANSLIKDVTAPTVITVALLQTAIDTSIAKNADPIKKDFAAIKTAATNASTRGVQPQEVFDAAKAKANEPTINIAANKAAIKTVLAAGTTALNTTGATAATVETAITGAVTAIADATVKAALAPVGAAATTAKNNTVASLGDVLNAVKAAAAVFIGDPVSKSSETSPGFMDLQLSFSTSEMTTASSESASFSQSSWGVDCFFGSVSSSSSSSSAYNSQSMFSSETEIKIGMKAAKVDIQRGWFNPGVFKLSKGMSRLSNMLVSKGPIDKTQSNLDDLNNAILPAFPVSFVIVKDVTMSFKVAESQLSAMHSVVDSKSATGGGFLCFSASSSSSSHSENSSMHSKTEGTVMTITMPNPQILGWFLETTPIDNSALMSTQEAAASDETINVINFIRKLKALSPKSV
jgi:hypothetical protein